MLGFPSGTINRTGWLAGWTFLLLAAAGVSAGEGVSGIWRGTMELGKDNPAQQISFTIRQKGDVFTGTVSIPGDNMNFAIEKGEYDDGYLSISGVSPVTLPDGSTPKLRFVYEGFTDDGGKVWEGDWRLEVAENNAPAGGGGAFKVTKGGATATDKPAKPDGEDKQPPATVVPMAGLWKGTVTSAEGEVNPASIEIRQKGNAFAGRVVPEEGSGMPKVEFTRGKMEGKKFTLTGSATVPNEEDGGEVAVAIVMSGDVNGDAWRGTIVGSVDVDGTPTPVITVKFKLQREDGARAKIGD